MFIIKCYKKRKLINPNDLEKKKKKLNKIIVHKKQQDKFDVIDELRKMDCFMRIRNNVKLEY